MIKIIELILPLVGVLIGWGCTELSNHFANIYIKRQTVNRAISMLLELYFQIKRISITVLQSQSFIEWYLAQFKGNAFNEEEKEILNNALASTINPLITELATYDINKIQLDYDNVLKELSSYYPVDAYRLRGRDDVKTILTCIDDYYDSIKNKIPVNEDDYNMVTAKIKPILQSQAIQGQLSAIREEIGTLSDGFSCSQRKDIITTLNNIDTDDNAYKQNFDEIKTSIMEILREKMPNLIHTLPCT